MKELREKLGVTDSRLYQLFQTKRDEYGNLIDATKAAALVACDNGVRIERYFTEEYRDGLLKLPHPLKAAVAQPQPTKRPRQGKGSPNGEVSITFAGKIPEKVPFVSASIAKEAARMSELYPRLYLFENSARMLVLTKMEGVHGHDWWQKVSRKIRDDVESRKQKENEVRWHGKRGAHEVFYTDMDDLRKIIETHWETVFKTVFGNQNQVSALFHEIELSRNVIAHNNPLDKDTIERLESNFKVWIKQTKVEGSLVP